MDQITIFTDGSSQGNPGPGGWGSVVVVSDRVVELGGAEKNTTNNRMELEAVIQGLQKASEACRKMQKDAEEVQVTINTDSVYVINGITKWIHGWKRNGWKTKTKDDVSNKDLWMELDAALNEIGSGNVSWKYVGGHVGIAGNERCDVIATSFADGESGKLYNGPLPDYSIKDILDLSHDKAKLKTKRSNSSRSNAKAYSYVSSVGGEIKIHHTWAECEKRVKGAKGAQYKKSTDAMNEAEIIDEFGAN
jgi:ribonuclease HI